MSELNLGRVAGSRWYDGDKITGTSTKETVFPESGVTYARESDLYLNLNASSSDRGKLYQCVKPGNPETATWVYVGNILGPMPDVVNNLTSNSTTKALSAYMGKTLQDELDATGVHPMEVEPDTLETSYTVRMEIEDVDCTLKIYDEDGNIGSFTHEAAGGTTATVYCTIGTSTGFPETGAVLQKIVNDKGYIKSYALYDSSNNAFYEETPNIWEHLLNDERNIVYSSNITEVNGEGEAVYYAAAVSKIVDAIRQEMFPITHAKAVWFNKLKGETIYDKLDWVDELSEMLVNNELYAAVTDDDGTIVTDDDGTIICGDWKYQIV